MATSRWAGRWAAACIGAAGVGLLLASPAVWAPLVACGALFAVFTSIRVSVGASGVRVAYGLLRWPSTRIGIDAVRCATTVDVIPSAWGGWGYRGSLRLLGCAAIVLRAGEGMRVDLRGGAVFLVTVDGAAVGAGVLNDLLRERSRLDPP